MDRKSLKITNIDELRRLADRCNRITEELREARVQRRDSDAQSGTWSVREGLPTPPRDRGDGEGR